MQFTGLKSSREQTAGQKKIKTSDRWAASFTVAHLQNGSGREVGVILNREQDGCGGSFSPGWDWTQNVFIFVICSWLYLEWLSHVVFLMTSATQVRGAQNLSACTTIKSTKITLDLLLGSAKCCLCFVTKSWDALGDAAAAWPGTPSEALCLHQIHKQAELNFPRREKGDASVFTPLLPN